MPKKDTWEGIEPDRAEFARSVIAAARQIADEDGDGEVADLSEASPGFKAVGAGFNRLVSRAAKGELDEDDPQDVLDALKVASAAMVDSRQPKAYQGFRWLTGSKEPLVPDDWAERFRFAGEAFQPEEKGQPYGPQEGPQVGVPSWTDVTPSGPEEPRYPSREWRGPTDEARMRSWGAEEEEPTGPF